MAHLLTGGFQTHALNVAASLRLADELADGGLAAEELAARVGADREALLRILRYLSSIGVFELGSDGRTFSNTPLSSTLIDGPAGLRDLAMMWTLTHMRPFEHLLDVVKEGQTESQTGSVRAYGKPFFDVLAEQGQAKMFASAMESVGSAFRAPSFKLFDQTVASKPGDVIVDVGGGIGYVVRGLLQILPEARGIVVDLETAVQAARESIARDGLSDRMEAHVADFFDASTLPKNGAVYILGFILHDWDDDHCVQILRNLHTCMPDHSTLAVSEFVISDEHKHDFAHNVDLIMLGVLSGKERTVEEFDSLLSRADFAIRQKTIQSNATSWIYATKA